MKLRLVLSEVWLRAALELVLVVRGVVATVAELRLAPPPVLLLAWLPPLELRLPLLELVVRLELLEFRLPPELKLRLEPALELREEDDE